ncbi:MAG: ASKHA domain-containing protein [bacterium]|nr:ASKHA domain-containing protein [bacterium]
MKEYKVIFYPGGEEANAPHGENLLRVAAAAGLYITASCGGNQTCGKCKVIIESGEIEGGLSDKLSPEEIEKGYRMACTSKIKSDLEVRIPVESQLSDKRVLTEATSKRLLIPESLETLAPEYKLNPLLKKYYLELPLPTLKDNIDDYSRLKRGLKQSYNFPDCSISLSCLKTIPGLLRKSGFKVTLTLLETGNIPEIVKIEEGDRTAEHYCIAIDIGTTSIYAALIDLSQGEVLATASDYNAQIAYGEDIINRIVYSQKGDGLKTLQEAVVKTIEGAIHRVLKEADISEDKISYLVAAGNTTMTHLLLGLDPKYIREAPYIPAINSTLQIQAAEVGLDLPAHVCLYLFPGAAGYIGGDITAGVLGTGIAQSDELILFIDIGTNGEVVLGNSEWMVAAACSAGPAFEGGTIKHGMRATFGAIEQVEIDENCEPMLITLGHKPPKGICGAGLISLIAELLETGIINQRGKFNTGLSTTRIRTKGGTKEYVLAFKDETGIDEDIVITEPDIDDLIRAKGAMYAGVSTLLNSVGLGISDISRIIIAGNLGFHLEVEKAITIGLFPEVDYSKFTFIGNGSLLGATLSACSREMFEKADEIARSITNIELSDNPEFMEEYMAALFLPHTEEKRFPEVLKRLSKHRCRRTEVR